MRPMLVIRFALMIAMSVIIYAHFNTTPSAPSGAGAKFVSVNPKSESSGPKGVLEIVYDLAYSWAGPGDTSASGLAGLNARREAETNPMANMSFSDMTAMARNSLSMANEMGVATGPTMFDPYIEAQDAANDPIRRLNGN